VGADELSSNPLLCVVHDDRGVRELLVGDLAARFGAQYEIEAHATADSAISALRRRARDGAAVAAVFNTETDSCGGETFRAAVHDLHPLARRVVLVGRGEWSKVHPAVAAMRSGQAEAYVFVPWTLRERWLYLPVTELLADWEASQPPPVEAAKVIGEEWDARAHALRELLGRIGVPFGFHPPASSEARHALGADDLTGGAFPRDRVPDGDGARRPAL
jgi:thioredoxin reductase (NADPH)